MGFGWWCRWVIQPHVCVCIHTLTNTQRPPPPKKQVVNKTVETQNEALQMLTWTLFYRRLVQNPNYYGLRAVGSRQLSEFLSDLVETVVEDLAKVRWLARRCMGVCVWEGWVWATRDDSR